MTQEQIDAIYQEIIRTKGCPANVADRLAAFEYGVRTALMHLHAAVSLDGIPESVIPDPDNVVPIT
jgi:hypothetical protein